MPELGGHPVPLLLYADDLVLISRSAGGLQDLLHTLHQLATYRRLQVSIKKTEVLVFQQRKPALASLPTFHYERKALKKVHQFKYLGLTVDSGRPLRNCVQVHGGLPLLCGTGAVGRAFSAWTAS